MRHGPVEKRSTSLVSGRTPARQGGRGQGDPPFRAQTPKGARATPRSSRPRDGARGRRDRRPPFVRERLQERNACPARCGAGGLSRARIVARQASSVSEKGAASPRRSTGLLCRAPRIRSSVPAVTRGRYGAVPRFPAARSRSRKPSPLPRSGSSLEPEEASRRTPRWTAPSFERSGSWQWS